LAIGGAVSQVLFYPTRLAISGDVSIDLYFTIILNYDGFS